MELVHALATVAGVGVAALAAAAFRAAFARGTRYAVAETVELCDSYRVSSQEKYTDPIGVPFPGRVLG